MTAKPEDNSSNIASVLVVEDFESFRRFICDLISQDSDFEFVGEASDGIEAINKVELLKPDIVLTDVGLPKLDGMSAARSMLSVSPNSRIVFLTSNTDPQIARAALAAGAAGFVAKVDADELSAALQAVRGGQSYISSTIKARLAEDLSSE